MDPDFYDDDLLPRATPITVPDGAIELYPRPMGPKIFLLPKEDRILKVGVKLSEAEAMRSVASKTSIPVPTVHDAYEQEGRSYIIMSRVHGKPLGEVWSSLCTEQKATIIRQLNHYMAELGTLSGDFYGSLWKSPLEDIFFHHFPFKIYEKTQYGPYFSRQEYNTGLVAALRNSRPDQALSASDQALAEKLLQIDDERTVFSHGDLHVNNIIVDDACCITGIVDWEGAGFSIPGRDYYEARSRARNKDWTEALPCIFPKDAQVHYELLQELDLALIRYTMI
jgi:aminoglycoside phosphotransferase (APT) family kinase protein